MYVFCENNLRTPKRKFKQVVNNLLGDPKVTANNPKTFVIQIQRRLRDYLRLLIGRTLGAELLFNANPAKKIVLTKYKKIFLPRFIPSFYSRSCDFIFHIRC